MTLPAVLQKLPLPIIGSPLFIISNPDLLIEQCKAGVIGSMPALNARPAAQLDEWLTRITEALAAHDRAHPDRPAAPYAINQIVHKSNDRLEQDMAVCARHKVPIVITSLGARTDVNDAVHGWGGIVLHDVINNTYARKAIDKGADGLIAVAAGAGGHAGVKSPFALIQEIREWFDGPLVLSGAIATDEARAAPGYKQMVVDSSSDDIVYSSLFTGVSGNYLKGSIVAAGLDPDQLHSRDATHMDFARAGAKAWKDIWGSGQGIGAVKKIVPARELVQRLADEYAAARKRLTIG